MSETPPPATEPASRSRRNRVRLVVQLAGFLIGIALLLWCARIAFSPENRAQLESLGEAPAELVVLLLALSAVTVIVNGVMFWFVLRPVKKIDLGGALATNALATFLSYLPFKLSLMARIAIHRQRDGVPLALIGPWFAAVGVVVVATIMPMVLMLIVRPVIDGLWFVMLFILLLISAGLLTALARLIGGQRGLRMVQSLSDRQPIGFIRRFTRSETFLLFDEAIAMLASYPQSLGAVMLRVVDLAAMAGRFYVASRIVGTPLMSDESIVGSATYFLIGVFSPVGALGTREAGTAGILDAFGEIDIDLLITISLVVTAAEMVVFTAMAAIGIAWLRPDRLIRGARGGPRADLSSPNADRAGQSEPDRR